MAEGKRQGRTLPERLTKHELQSLLAAPSLRAPTGLRNHVLMRLMAYCALRCDEVLELRVSDIHDGELHLRRTKGARQRIATLDPDTERMLHRWLEHRPPDNDGHVFVTLKGKPLSDRYLRAMVEREAKAAGIERPVVVDEETGKATRRRVSPHTLRHTAACLALEGLLPGQTEPLTVEEVRKWLGHSHLQTTAMYLHGSPTSVERKLRGNTRAGQGRRGSDVWFQMDGCAVDRLPPAVGTDREAELAALKEQLAALSERIAKLEAELLAGGARDEAAAEGRNGHTGRRARPDGPERKGRHESIRPDV